jgi:ribonuclease E
VESVPLDDDDIEAPSRDIEAPRAASPSGENGDLPRRKRGSRGGRRRKPKKAGGAVSIEVIPGDDDELPELAELPDDSVLVGAPSRGRRRGRVERDEDADDEDEDERDEPARRVPHKKRVILVNARDTEEKRVAVVEEGRIVDLQMTVKKHVSYVNDIYRGRVVNIESAIGAAFVDFGEGRNGFLHASDVLPSYGEPDWNLEKLLSTPVETAPEPEADLDGDGEAWSEGEKSASAALAVAATDGEREDEDDAEEPEESGPVRSERGARRGRVARHRVRARVPIDKLLKKGQMVAVQITKDAIGDKGPTLTTYISIPGRYLVLMPSLERTGVSRKIDDDRERRRLKRILQSLDIPEGMGVIVRTAGIGRTKTEIKRDLEYLLLAWEDFAKRLRAGRNPAPLYQESDVAIRTMRDLFTPETESVSVDDPEVFQRMIEFTKRLMPEHLDRVRLHEGERPLFHSHGVEQDFEKIFARRVELPSGGSIVIEQTEALVAIDVNSGRTREEGAEFEDIALKTNLEAAPEIARQIRLRDLGGIIVLDYIDMMRAGSRKSVERATRDALKADRARAKIGRISQFGLLELTRQRLGPGLSKLVYDTCPRCRGSGRRRNASSRAQAIMRRLAAALALKGYATVEVRTHPDVIDYLQKELATEMAKLQEQSGREIKLLAVPEQVEDSVLHYLRSDGREVRPGGRRRR